MPRPTETLPQIAVVPPEGPAQLALVRELFAEYGASLGAAIDPQAFAAEIDALPGEYGEPRGGLLLALVDGDAAGCCAIRPLDTVDYSNAAEMKRLYVRKAFRGFGLGRQLAEAALDLARRGGYACVLLDTLDEMESARALYAELGFEDIPPYQHHPAAGAHHLKVDI
ncbi:MAG: GNAT family N-acetyltransferase [Xylophilus ampelinus]